ncbi:MAG TPA: sigma D regulator [Psychromonas hadalis]|nr:sigma D regulator [Psychromonas hadalis]
MLEKLEHAKEVWGGSLAIFDNWLSARQDIVILYCELAGLPPHQKVEGSLPNQEKITLFCQKLLDYASKGHFEIYEMIIDKCKVDSAANLEKAVRLYARITATTDLTLNFNDKYAESPSESVLLDTFYKDLSVLGEVMESRFEREDELLNVVHLHHTLS